MADARMTDGRGGSAATGGHPPIGHRGSGIGHGDAARWVGVDEAGYGPNLGPLVMSAVVAQGPADRPPDLWRDLAATVARAGAGDGRLWVDDSKRVYKARKGRDRLEAAALATVDAAGAGRPISMRGLLAAVGASATATSAFEAWAEGVDVPLPTHDRIAEALAARPFDGACWRLVAARSVVVDAAEFNALLIAGGGSKAAVHHAAFARLLAGVWADGVPASLRSDKHGGRHFYAAGLRGALPGADIQILDESPALSRYAVTAPGRRLAVAFEPRADAADGLVALASILSKAIRELWMDAFNAHWAARVPGLRPTAGYPTDAARYRAAVAAGGLGAELEGCWRRK